MKKIFTLLMVVAVAIVSTACQSPLEIVPANNLKPMTVAVAKLTQGEQDILDLTGHDGPMFDYLLDDSVVSSEVYCWIYEDGVWIENGGMLGNIDDKISGRILIQGLGTKEDLVLAENTNDGKDTISTSRLTFNTDHIDKDNTSAMLTSWLSESEPTPIVLEQQIVLGMSVTSNETSIRTTDLGLFGENNNERLDEYDSVTAITIKFSKTDMSQKPE